VTTPRALADLPFARRPPLELLGLTHDRDEIDTGYAGFGWTLVDRLWLDDGAGLTAVDDALVLALHAADDGAALGDDVELEFELGDARAIAPLSAFLARWLPRLPTAATVVLALCNPHHARLPAPPAAGGRPLWYGRGPVDSWLDHHADHDRLRLVAAAGWHLAHAPEAP
jgi:hypothetical protein